MLFYPILEAPKCKGWVTISNFPPNNWEVFGVPNRWIQLLWSDGQRWQVYSLGKISRGESRTIAADALSQKVPEGVSCFLYLSDRPYTGHLPTLPVDQRWHTQVPAWRSTLGLAYGDIWTSYQGEIPYPPKHSGTLLSFLPLMQWGEGVSNYLLLVNLEITPKRRLSNLEVYRAADRLFLGTAPVTSNHVNVIRLDQFGLKSTDIPVLVCRDLVAIPLLFTCSADGQHLSLEHTHPPASLAIHGKRWNIQKQLKRYWLSELCPSQQVE
jgi:hypothetical protein